MRKCIEYTLTCCLVYTRKNLSKSNFHCCCYHIKCFPVVVSVLIRITERQCRMKQCNPISCGSNMLVSWCITHEFFTSIYTPFKNSNHLRGLWHKLNQLNQLHQPSFLIFLFYTFPFSTASLHRETIPLFQN